MHEAILYNKLPENRVKCYLCAHQCLINPQALGFCGMRQNIDGVLISHTYGKIIAENADPVEKKPLYHFLPSTKTYSIAAPGCNFRCGFCQNWQISQMKHSLHNNSIREVSPQKVVENALNSGSKSIACTYTEPTIFLEYAIDIFKIAKTQQLKTILVTNGYMTTQAIDKIRDIVDACNIDLKSFSNEFYKKNCAASLPPVLESIKKIKECGIWVEITSLIIPGQNDSDEELGKIAAFIAQIDVEMPWHISRFFPQYKFNNYNPTDESTIQRAQKIAEEAGLKFVYPGNVSADNSTVCYHCKKVLIKREGYRIKINTIKENRCSNCNTVISGIWES